MDSSALKSSRRASHRHGRRTGPARPAGAGTPAPSLATGAETVVLVAAQAERCAECSTAVAVGNLYHLEEHTTLCLNCALLERLVYLPSGNVALTRRAAGHSECKAIVMEWSRSGKRWERRGTLVEPAALALAKMACAADKEQRAAQRVKAAARREIEDRQFIADFTHAVLGQFPNCPVAETREIAAHACEKHSGRVGRTAAAKELEPHAVRLAVIAHVRHLHTDYDRIIEYTHDKRGSRDRIRANVTEVLREWEAR